MPARKLLTSQTAIDDDLIDALYEQADGRAMALRDETINARDMVVSDGVDAPGLAVRSGRVNGRRAA